MINVSKTAVLSVPEFMEVIVLSEEAMCVLLSNQDYNVLKAGNTGTGNGDSLRGKTKFSFAFSIMFRMMLLFRMIDCSLKSL